MDIKFPDITVKLTGKNGNAFLVIGLVCQALRKAKVPGAEVKQFQDEATGGDYNNLLQTCMKWVNVE
jgi:hypothetical protein